MDTVIFNNEWLEELDKWIVQTLQKYAKIKTLANKGVWWYIYELNKLTDLNTARYFSTEIDRNLNRTETLAGKIENNILKIKGMREIHSEEMEINQILSKKMGTKDW